MRGKLASRVSALGSGKGRVETKKERRGGGSVEGRKSALQLVEDPHKHRHPNACICAMK